MQIDPKWKHAIDVNLCPFCGKGIMEEKLKDLLSSLRITMDALQEYPEQLDDWMLSNFDYIKSNSPNLKNLISRNAEDNRSSKDAKFKVKVETENGMEEVLAEKIQSDEKTESFFKRADALKPNIDGFRSQTEKTEHLKKMVQQIKSSGSRGINMEGGADIITPEMLDNADPEAVAEMQNILSGGEAVSSSIDSLDDSDDPPPFVVAALTSKTKTAGSNSADILKQQRMYDKVAESRRNFATGAKGSFSRS